MFKKIAMFYFIAVTAATIGFFGGKITTENRLVAEHRQQLELYRTKSEQYENTYRQARETNSELGKCLSESVTTLSGLRRQISEVRTRYEKMEELLNSSWDNDSNIRGSNSCTYSVDEGEVSDQ